MRKIVSACIIGLMSLLVVACQNDAIIASQNLSKAADNFEIDRRVVFYNGINGEYMLTIEGKCSITDQHRQLEVTCKVGPNDNEVMKHFLGLSDNVTYFVEQLKGHKVSFYHHRVTFKPQSIMPDFDFRGDGEALITNESG